MSRRRNGNSVKNSFKLNSVQAVFVLLFSLFYVYLLTSTVNYGLTQRMWDNGGLVEYTGKCISQYYESHAHRNNECFILDNGEVVIVQSRVLASAGFDRGVFEGNQASKMTFIYTPHRNFGSRYKQIVGIRFENTQLIDEIVTKADHKTTHSTLVIFLLLCVPVFIIGVAPYKLFACAVAMLRIVNHAKHSLISKSTKK